MKLESYPFSRVIVSFLFSPAIGAVVICLLDLFFLIEGGGGFDGKLMLSVMRVPMVVAFGCMLFSPASLIIGVILVVNRIEKTITSILWSAFGGVIAAVIMSVLIGSGMFVFACLGGISAAVAAFSLPSPEEMEKRRQM